jgi:hypothetical protein
MGASTRPHQLLAQGSEGLLLGPLHRHRADLQLRCGGSQGQPLDEGEPQGRGLGRRQLLHQQLQRRPGEGGLQRGPSDGCRQLLQQGELTGGGSIKAGVAKRPGAFLMLAAGDAHQPHPIAQVMLQGPGDAARLQPTATGFSFPNRKITSRKSQVVEIDDLGSLPPKWFALKTTIQPDKGAINEAIKAGHLIPGAQLISRRSWRIH